MGVYGYIANVLGSSFYRKEMMVSLRWFPGIQWDKSPQGTWLWCPNFSGSTIESGCDTENPVLCSSGSKCYWGNIANQTPDSVSCGLVYIGSQDNQPQFSDFYWDDQPCQHFAQAPQYAVCQ